MCIQNGLKRRLFSFSCFRLNVWVVSPRAKYLQQSNHVLTTRTTLVIASFKCGKHQPLWGFWYVFYWNIYSFVLPLQSWLHGSAAVLSIPQRQLADQLEHFHLMSFSPIVDLTIHIACVCDPICLSKILFKKEPWRPTKWPSSSRKDEAKGDILRWMGEETAQEEDGRDTCQATRVIACQI